MPADRLPGGGATQKDAMIRIPDREVIIATLGRIISLVENESTRLRGRPDSRLKLTAEPGIYWTIQAQRGLLPGYNNDTPSLTATLNSRQKDGLPPIESIRADVVELFGTRVGGINLHPRTGERSWDEQADVARLAGLVDAYFTPKPTATEKTVTWAAKVARAELGGMAGAHIGKHMIEVDPKSDKLTIWELNGKNGTKRLIMSDPGAPESPEGTPVRPARISIQDLDRGIIFGQRSTRRMLRRTILELFPNYKETPSK